MALIRQTIKPSLSLKKYNDYPRLGSVVGYTTIKALAAGMRKAGGADTEKLITAFSGLQFDTPFGKASFRASDHQCTMGAFVGRTTLRGGKGEMKDYRYFDGSKFLPSDEDVKKLRPAS
jgi:branched-chain amino acid transport system substrate-binding protein